MIDTVANAEATPEASQPWAELGLKENEYLKIKEILGRRPTSCELAMYSVMWSEHCSYKSSKIHLKRFAALSKDTPRGPLLAGIGEQAGVVGIGDDWAVTFKIESHNHPSFVEPYQGAATGVGGIVRDILAMGARPIGVMDSLRFGPLAEADTARVLPGVVAGIGGYGNCLGLPNIGGEVYFDRSYLGNPLVNALCVGVLKKDEMHLAHASGLGNKVILYGAATGGDGIGGASILASETFDADGPAKRPSVQVGDPFMEKLLIECTLELIKSGIIIGIQDFGAAGISCATSELASAGDGGMFVDLDRVVLRDPTLAPEEILMSESQERMMAVVAPENVDTFMQICAKWEVLATVIGEVIEGDRLIINWRGEKVVDVDPKTVAHEGPVYERPIRRPAWIDQVNNDDANALPKPWLGSELEAQVLALVGSQNLCDKSWITNQYDRYVRGNTAMAQPEDSGILRIDEETGLGIALAVDGNGRYGYLNPYIGAQLSLAEAYRNVAVTGAQPVAITDCLNFGSPEDPDVMWQFEEAILGLVDGCKELGTPVTGGNVSFYNQTDGENILPTPVIGMLGVIDNVADRVCSKFKNPGDQILLIGDTYPDFAGSAWADVIHGHLGGRPPLPSFAHEKRIAQFCQAAAKAKLLQSAHDLSEGGLALAAIESALGNHLGFSLALPEGVDSCTWLFAETPGRVLLSVSPEKLPEVEQLLTESGLSYYALGEVMAQPHFVLRGVFTLDLAKIREVWAKPIPQAICGS